MKNLFLQYVIVIGLPKTEIEYLIENLSEEESLGELPDERMVFIYDLTENESVGEGVPKIQRKETEDFLEDFKYFPPERTLLITAEDCCLELALNYKMASLGYLAKRDETKAPAYADMYAEGFEEIDWTFLRHVYERHHHLPWTILKTERCIVQEFSMEWLSDLFDLYAGEGMTDYIEPLYEYEKEKEYQEAYIEYMYRFYGFGMWIVREKETGRLIGRAGLECREELGGKVELGYVIGRPYQRKGYAAEVCTAILDYAKETLLLEDICCLIEHGNEKSMHLAEKLGFHRENVLELGGKQMVKYIKIL